MSTEATAVSPEGDTVIDSASEQEPWPICTARPHPNNIADPGPDGILDISVNTTNDSLADGLDDEAIKLYLKDGGNTYIDGVPYIGVFTTKKWQSRRILRVRFLDSGGYQDNFLQLIVRTAATWSQHASITFQLVTTGPAEIRVTMAAKNTFWSYLGTDSLRDPSQPSMNLGFTSGSAENPPPRFQNIVLHEFGHALALVHEHQTPKSGINWIERQVIDDCRKWYGWDERQTRSQILSRYSVSDVWSTTLDLESIMIYAFPRTWNRNGYSADWRPHLSTVDRNMIGKIYPP